MKLEVIKKNWYDQNSYAIEASGSDKVIVIDPGLNRKAIEEYLTENKRTLAAMLLTHGHYDHISDLPALVGKYGVPVYASEDEAELLANPEWNGSAQNLKEGISFTNFNRLSEGSYEIDGIAFDAIKTPGHTKGGMCFLFGQDLITGDTLFAGTIGRCDLATADLEEMKVSLRKLYQLDPTIRIFPGHGKPSTLAEEKERNPYFNDSYLYN